MFMQHAAHKTCSNAIKISREKNNFVSKTWSTRKMSSVARDRWTSTHGSDFFYRTKLIFGFYSRQFVICANICVIYLISRKTEKLIYLAEKTTQRNMKSEKICWTRKNDKTASFGVQLSRVKFKYLLRFHLMNAIFCESTVCMSHRNL